MALKVLKSSTGRKKVPYGKRVSAVFKRDGTVDITIPRKAATKRKRKNSKRVASKRNGRTGIKGYYVYAIPGGLVGTVNASSERGALVIARRKWGAGSYRIIKASNPRKRVASKQRSNPRLPYTAEAFHGGRPLTKQARTKEAAKKAGAQLARRLKRMSDGDGTYVVVDNATGRSETFRANPRRRTTKRKR
jgi:hypothetical protein